MPVIERPTDRSEDKKKNIPATASKARVAIAVAFCGSNALPVILARSMLTNQKTSVQITEKPMRFPIPRGLAATGGMLCGAPQWGHVVAAS